MAQQPKIYYNPDTGEPADEVFLTLRGEPSKKYYDPDTGEPERAEPAVRGNIDLYNQPSVKNPQGGKSTVYSRSYNIDGKEVLLPSVTPDGRFLESDDDVVNEYKKTGRNLGIFDSPELANIYAKQLHDDYESGKYDSSNTEVEPLQKESLLKRVWDTVNTPIVNVGGDPKIKAGAEIMKEEHPTTVKTLEFITSVLSGLTSPLNIATAGAFGGSGAALKAGLPKVAQALSRTGGALSAPVAAEGAINLADPESTWPERVVGGLQAVGGIFGMRSGLRRMTPGASATPENIKLTEPIKIDPNLSKPEWFKGSDNEWRELVTNTIRSKTKLEPPTAEVIEPKFVKTEKGSYTIENPSNIQFPPDFPKPEWFKGTNLQWKQTIEMYNTLLPKTDNLIEPSVQDRLKQTFSQIPAKIEEQLKINTATRAERIAKVGEVTTPGRAGFFEEKGKLAGEFPKVGIEPLKLNVKEIDDLFDRVKGVIPDKFAAIRARDALDGLLKGEIPNQSDLDYLRAVLEVTEDLPESVKMLKTHSMIRQIYELTRGFKSVDIPFMTSAAFRQSGGMFLTRNWFRAYANSAKAFKNESVYNSILEENSKSIINRKRVIGGEVTTTAEALGIKRHTLRDLTSRDEQIRAELAERVPIYGRFIRANNRSFTAFQDTIKTRAAEDWLRAANAIDDKGNIIDIESAQRLANTVNELTGYGSLTFRTPYVLRKPFKKLDSELSLEKIGDELSLILWSPRLMARDARMMNPMTYLTNDKITRLKYLEGAVRRAAAWATFTGSAVALLGAQVDFDPTSSNFAKPKIKDTRMDAGSGLLQWIVLSSRLALGESTSSSRKKTTELGSSAIARTRLDVSQEFLQNKIHPTLRPMMNFLLASKNRPFFPLSEATSMIAPIPSEDIIDLIKSDPEMEAIILGLTGVATSMGGSTYGPRDFGKPQINIPGDAPFKGGRLFGR